MYFGQHGEAYRQIVLCAAGFRNREREARQTKAGGAAAQPVQPVRQSLLVRDVERSQLLPQLREQFQQALVAQHIDQHSNRCPIDIWNGLVGRNPHNSANLARIA